MKVSANGRKAIKLHEGVRTKAYQDSVGVWTIGVGHTAQAGAPAPKAGMVITDAEVDEILARDLVTFENVVSKAVKAPINQNQFDALVSLAFNIGGGAFAKSTLVRKLNAGDTESASAQFGVWVKAGGRTLQGLVNRRAAERKLFDTPALGGATVPTQPLPVPTPPSQSESLWVKLLRLLRAILVRR